MVLFDALVSLVIRYTLVAKRHGHTKWSVDFNSDEDIYPGRLPMVHPVIIWVIGLRFLTVYADQYILTCSSLREYVWLLTSNSTSAVE